MKVVLKPIYMFEVETEDGRSLGHFSKESEWNGMSQLKRGDNVLIVHSDSTFESMLNRMVESKEGQTVEVIKLSPPLAAKIHHNVFSVDQELDQLEARAAISSGYKLLDTGMMSYWIEDGQIFTQAADVGGEISPVVSMVWDGLVVQSLPSA